MNGRIHAAELIKKCAGRISFLYRNSSLLDFNCRKTLCSSLILPYLEYCCSSWYSSLTKQLKDKLDVLQRRLVRFVFSMDPRDHVGSDHLAKLNWMTISDRVGFFKLIHVFKIRNGLAPGYLANNFNLITSTHGHFTRGSVCNYSISRDMSNSPTSFVFTAVKNWNCLPNFLKEIQSLPVFKTKLKGFILSDY
jgi:hypothetical protein